MRGGLVPDLCSREKIQSYGRLMSQIQASSATSYGHFPTRHNWVITTIVDLSFTFGFDVLSRFLQSTTWTDLLEAPG